MGGMSDADFDAELPILENFVALLMPIGNMAYRKAILPPHNLIFFKVGWRNMVSKPNLGYLDNANGRVGSCSLGDRGKISPQVK